MDIQNKKPLLKQNGLKKCIFYFVNADFMDLIF